MPSLDEWVRSGRYLPVFMRDFHDQKLLFKRIDEIVQRRRAKEPYAEHMYPSWIAAHIYVVDFFLWYMAKMGYTLQRTRVNVEVCDLDADLADFRKRYEEAVWAALKEPPPGE